MQYFTLETSWESSDQASISLVIYCLFLHNRWVQNVTCQIFDLSHLPKKLNEELHSRPCKQPGRLGGRQVLRHCAFTVNPHRPVSPSAGHWPGWQQPWWSGMHCSPSWLQGCGRHCVSYNAPVEYKRPCSCYFHQSGACWRWPTTI